MTVNIKVLVGQLVYLVLFFSLPLFLAAGTLVWPAGWVYLALVKNPIPCLLLS